jgi:hypothetical protein
VDDAASVLVEMFLWLVVWYAWNWRDLIDPNGTPKSDEEETQS